MWFGLWQLKFAKLMKEKICIDYILLFLHYVWSVSDITLVSYNCLAIGNTVLCFISVCVHAYAQKRLLRLQTKLT